MIYDIFYMFLLKYNNIEKGQIRNKSDDLELDLDSSNNKKYKVENIKGSTIYIKEVQE